MHSLRALWAKISGDGWRRIAFINTIAVTVFTLFVIILLAWSTSQSRGLDSNLIFFDGHCARSTALNLWLHLLLNACSTGVIASSNFFMQVLSSPTRSEVDKAHRKDEKLAIGVPSLSNLFHVSPFKGVCWLLFFASSFPIHLFFNSAIFATKYKGAGFHLSIAADGFIDGAQYLGPGAVLWRAGAPGTEPAILPDDGTGYGSVVNVTQYFDQGSKVARNIEFAARSARRWQRLDVPECLSQYMYCNSHDTMRDVVWVVKSHNSSGNFMNPGNSSLGWRSFDVLATMGLVDAAFWNDLVPRKANNSLWFAANCSTSVFFKKDTQTIEGCSQSCSSAMGSSVAKLDSRPAESIPSSYNFDFFPGLDGYTEEELSQVYWPGLIDQSAATLDLQYCLAEEISTTCKVGLSNKILLVVLVCLLVKTTLCVAVLFIMPAKDPLVVPGDAVVSFICSADKFTAGWCTLDRKREGETSVARICAAGKATPVQWHAAPFRRWASAIPRLVWGRSYGLFITDILFVGIMFGVAQKSSPLGSRDQTFSASATNGLLSTKGYAPEQLISCVVTANLPQLLLSLSYFVYNSLFTRLCTEKEWSSYAVDYRPLRVTRPRGQQRSTYRLQLPYRYSIPLIVVSILLHWLVSNSLYVFVLEGGYYWLERTVKDGAGTGLSDDAYIGIGYSTIALLSIFVSAAVLALVPIVLTMVSFKSPMPIGASNSLVISAACHVPILEDKQTGSHYTNSDSPTAEPQFIPFSSAEDNNDQAASNSRPGSETLEMQRLLTPDDRVSSSNCHTETLDTDRYFLDASQKPLRWGAVKTPGSCNHLSFGTRNHCVEEPVEGQFYQ